MSIMSRVPPAILAKCLREMEKIQKNTAIQVPGISNLTTEISQGKLNKHPEIFRKSWISWKIIVTKTEKLDEFEC